MIADREHSLRIARLDRAEMRARLEAVAELRMTVFSEWPYLYIGDADYERRYLDRFIDAEGAVIIGAFDGDRLVGASTAAPLADHFSAFAEPIAKAGYSPDRVFYLSESVLLPDYRGMGAGKPFFAEREAAGREQGFDRFVFCAVDRSKDDPRRPANYRPLDGFWNAIGYRRLDGVTASFEWQEVGDVEESAHQLTFWMKSDA